MSKCSHIVVMGLTSRNQLHKLIPSGGLTIEIIIHITYLTRAYIAQANSFDPKETLNTVMLINKLNLFPVPVRLHLGSGKLKYRRYFTTFFDI